MQKYPTLADLPHLAASMSFRSSTGATMCVQRSAALMLDLTGATLVFGIVRASTPEERETTEPNGSPVPFIHAWVEYRGELLAPTLFERFGELRSFPIEFYYATNGVTKTWRLEHKAFMQVARRFRLSAAYKHDSARARDGSVTDALLRAAGVKYVLSDQRTLLPA